MKGVVECAEMFASMAGEFVDLRRTPDHACLDPDPAVGYRLGSRMRRGRKGSTESSALPSGMREEPASRR